MNAGELPEVMETAGGWGDCFKLRQVAGKAHKMTENALSILIANFTYNSNKPRPQTESCVFSDVAHTIIILFFWLWNISWLVLG